MCVFIWLIYHFIYHKGKKILEHKSGRVLKARLSPFIAHWSYWGMFTKPLDGRSTREEKDFLAHLKEEDAATPRAFRVKLMS